MKTKLFFIMFFCLTAAALAQSSPIKQDTMSRDQPTEVMSKQCPYNCNLAGYSHWGCASWKKGNMCYIGPVKKATHHKHEKAAKPVTTEKK